jgi:hypothetical protein
MKKLLAALLLLSSFYGTVAHAGPNWLGGSISSLTSATGGLLIMLDSGIPDNCQGTPYGWMLIKEVDRALTAVALTMWATGRKAGTVYTSAPASVGGYCVITQLQPVN